MKKLLIAAALTTAVIISVPKTHSSAAVANSISLADSVPPSSMNMDDTSKMKHKMWKKTKKDSTMSKMSPTMTKGDTTRK